MKGRNRRYGFTLIEVAAATVLLGLLVIPLLGARNRAVAAAARSSKNFMMAQLAASKLSELAVIPLEEIESSGEFEELPGYSWEIVAEPEEIGTEEEDVPADEAAEPFFYRITLTISYPDYSKEDETGKVVIGTLIFRREVEDEEDGEDESPSPGERL